MEVREDFSVLTSGVFLEVSMTISNYGRHLLPELNTSFVLIQNSRTIKVELSRQFSLVSIRLESSFDD